jgi:hypothetical protein
MVKPEHTFELASCGGESFVEDGLGDELSIVAVKDTLQEGPVVVSPLSPWSHLLRV